MNQYLCFFFKLYWNEYVVKVTGQSQIVNVIFFRCFLFKTIFGRILEVSRINILYVLTFSKPQFFPFEIIEKAFPCENKFIIL